MEKNKRLAVGELVDGSDFEILDSVKPSINGKNVFQRILIRRIGRRSEKIISLCNLCEVRKGSRECDNCEMEAYVLAPTEGE
jgi:hypothetical protein